jgi:hypothetical protein
MGGMKDLLGDNLFTLPTPPAAQAFDGSTYRPARDHARLKGQLAKVSDLMCDGEWRTLRQIQNVVGGSEAAVSARLRDLRKPKYGGHEVLRQNVGAGLFRYRLRVTS